MKFIAFGICAAVIVVIYILIEIRKAKKRTFTIVTNSQPSSMSSGPNYEEIARQRQQRFLDRNGKKIAELTPIEAVPSHVVDNQLRNKKIFWTIIAGIMGFSTYLVTYEYGLDIAIIVILGTVLLDIFGIRVISPMNAVLTMRQKAQTEGRNPGEIYYIGVL